MKESNLFRRRNKSSLAKNIQTKVSPQELKAIEDEARERLFTCVKFNEQMQLQELMDRFLGISLEQEDNFKNSMLNIAVQCGNFDIADLLLRHGAEVNTVNVSRYL